MADSDWEKVVKRPHEVCYVCEEAFPAESEIVSALSLGEEGFEREDLHPKCFDSLEENPFSVWRWHKEKELKNAQRRLDLGFLTEFFKRLDGQDDEQSHRVRWIVMLLLMRKRILEEVSRETVDGVDTLTLKMKKSDRTFEVPDPQLDDEAMSSIEDDLGRIFNLT